MAPEALKSRLAEYLQSRGLRGEDVPKVLGTFLVGKYVACGAMIGLSLYCKPLRRLFWRRPDQPVAVPAWMPMWVQRQSSVQTALRRYNKIRERTRAHVTGVKDRYTQLKEQTKNKLIERTEKRDQTSGSGTGGMVRQKYAQAKARLALRASMQAQIWRQKLQRPREPGTVHSWMSQKFWFMSDKLAGAAEKNAVWRFVAKCIRIPPRDLALGIAEGIILYKFTFPITAPLGLWCIVYCYRPVRLGESQESAREKAVKQASSYITRAKRLFEAAGEADEKTSKTREDLADSSHSILLYVLP